MHATANPAPIYCVRSRCPPLQEYTSENVHHWVLHDMVKVWLDEIKVGKGGKETFGQTTGVWR